MPVPPEDMVCRFIRPRDWNKANQSPKPSAFKDKRGGLSVWHLERLQQQSVPIEDLLIDHLAGWGQAHHLASDYVDFAAQAAQQTGQPLQSQVEWRPEDEYVAPPWRRWRYAHAQAEVEDTEESTAAFTRFCRLLSLNCQATVTPAEANQPRSG